jgi:hypothetical protein
MEDKQMLLANEEVTVGKRYVIDRLSHSRFGETVTVRQLTGKDSVLFQYEGMEEYEEVLLPWFRRIFSPVLYKAKCGNIVEVTAIETNVVYYNQTKGEKSSCLISHFKQWIKDNEATAYSCIEEKT